MVFKAAAQLVAANPELQARLRVLPSTKRILRRDGGGFYGVLSADGDLQDGIEPSLAIRDEVHRWKTARAETLHDVITKGQISRPEPLDIGITTAGAEYESPLWWREYQHAKKVLDGSLCPSDTFYPAIWEADAKRIENDPGVLEDAPEARIAANPSHEDTWWVSQGLGNRRRDGEGTGRTFRTVEISSISPKRSSESSRRSDHRHEQMAGLRRRCGLAAVGNL